MKAIERGSITALVGACGVRSTPTRVWQQAWWTTRPAATPTDQPPSTAPRARSSASGRSDSSASRISGAPRSDAPSVTGLASGPYSASMPCARAFMAVAVSVSRGAEAISAGSHTASAGRPASP